MLPPSEDAHSISTNNATRSSPSSSSSSSTSSASANNNLIINPITSSAAPLLVSSSSSALPSHQLLQQSSLDQGVTTNNSRSSSPNLTVVVDTLSTLTRDFHKNNFSNLTVVVSNGSTVPPATDKDDSIVRANFVDFNLDSEEDRARENLSSGCGLNNRRGGGRTLSASSSSGGEPAEEEEDEDEEKDFYNLSLNPDLHKIRAEQIRNWLEYENNHSNNNSLASGISTGELGDESREFEEDSLNLHDVVNLSEGRNRRVRFLTDQEGNLLISVFLTNMMDDEEQQRLHNATINNNTSATTQNDEVEINNVVETETTTNSSSSSSEENQPDSIHSNNSSIIENGHSDNTPFKLDPDLKISQVESDKVSASAEAAVQDIDLNNNESSFSASSVETIMNSEENIKEELQVKAKENVETESSTPLVFIVLEDAKNDSNYSAMVKNMNENIIGAVDSEINDDSENDENDPESELVKLAEETNDSQEFSDSETLSASSSCDSMIEIIPGANRSNVPVGMSLKDEMEMEYNKEIADVMEKFEDENRGEDQQESGDPPQTALLSPVDEGIEENNNNNLSLPTRSKAELICYDEADKSMTCFEFNPGNEKVIVAEQLQELQEQTPLEEEEEDIMEEESVAIEASSEETVETKTVSPSPPVVEEKEGEPVEVVKDIETEIAKLEREIEEEIKGRTENANTTLKFNPIIASAAELLVAEASAEEHDQAIDMGLSSESEITRSDYEHKDIVANVENKEENNIIDTNHSEDIESAENGAPSGGYDNLTMNGNENEAVTAVDNNNENQKPATKATDFEISSEAVDSSEVDSAEQQMESLLVEEEPISSVALQIAKWESLAKKMPSGTKSIGSSTENLHIGNNGALALAKGKLVNVSSNGNGTHLSTYNNNNHINNKNGLAHPSTNNAGINKTVDNCPTKQSTVWNCWNKSNKGADDEEIIYAQPNNNTVMMTSLSNPSAVLKSHPKPSSRGEILNWFKDGEIHRAGLIISNSNTFGIHHHSSTTINNNNNNGDGSPTNAPVVVSWFFGLITRAQAEKFLLGQPTGTFLVRISTRIWGYTLSYQSNQRTKHFLISAHNPAAVPPSLQTEKDKIATTGSKNNLPKPLLSAFASQGRYAFIGTNMTPYTTLASLIRHHSHAPITKSGGEKLLFPAPGGPNLTGVEYLFK